MTLRSRLGAALAAVLVGTAASVSVGSPAQAAACATGTGVTVVVDYHQLGGGTSTTCVPDGGGKYAAAVFGSAGVGMQYAQGFVCRVNGKPDDEPCTDAPPVNAYWSLWRSSGNGSWSYAQRGVGSLKVSTGDWVAWSWNGSNGQVQPGVDPVGPKATAPRPTVRPTTTPTSGNGSTGGSTGGSKGSDKASPGPSTSTKPSATPSPSTAAQKKAATKAKAKAEASASASASASTSASAKSSDDAAKASSESDGGPGGLAWVAIVVLLALGASGGVVAWRRRASADL